MFSPFIAGALIARYSLPRHRPDDQLLVVRVRRSLSVGIETIESVASKK